MNIHTCNYPNLIPTDVTPPAQQRLTIKDVFDPASNKPNPEVLKKHFQKEGRVEEDVAMKIINQGKCWLWVRVICNPLNWIYMYW